MVRRRPPVPDGIELIGAAAEPDDELVEPDDPGTGEPSDDRGSRTPWWAWVALAVAAAAVLTLAADRLGDDDAPAHEPEPSGLGVFDLDRIRLDDAVSRNDVDYPLWGRDWGQSLVMLQRDTLVAVDLDTGEHTELFDLSALTGTARYVDLRTYGDTLLLVDEEGGAIRVRGDTAESVATDGSDRSGFEVGTTVVGAWEIEFDRTATGDPSNLDLRPLLVDDADATEVTLSIGDNAAPIGDELLLQQAGTLEILSADGQRRPWATGSITAYGNGVVVWRSCAAGDCVYWAGTADDPTHRAVDPDAISDEPLFGTVAQADIVGPQGVVQLGFERGTMLIDSGDAAEVGFVTGPQVISFSADGTAIVTKHGVGPVMVDLATGDAAAIDLADGAGALREAGLAFMDTELLPRQR